MKEYKHIDCVNYIPVDASKGLCHADKSLKPADDCACDKFTRLPKCRYCGNYASTDEFLGKCKDTHAAYPDMTAKTCKDFKWKD